MSVSDRWSQVDLALANKPEAMRPAGSLDTSALVVVVGDVTSMEAIVLSKYIACLLSEDANAIVSAFVEGFILGGWDKGAACKVLAQKGTQVQESYSNLQRLVMLPRPRGRMRLSGKL
jgi:hypothetical protein